MVLPDGRVESCGNFHGAPLGFACDFLAIAVAEVGAIAERRTDRLLDATRSHGLPPFLTAEPGVNSGLMIAQYTQAALVAENRRLAAPASVGSLPTSAMQEDHVSMGWAAARKLRTSLQNLGRILAVELTCAAHGLDLRAPLQPGRAARRRSAPCARASPARAPTAGSRPTSPPPRSSSPPARCRTRSRRPWGRWREPRDPRAARLRAVLQGLAAGGRAADADEQPRPGRRRAPRGPRRLRRHRPRRALVGGLRRDRRARCATSRATRRCSCSRASRSASCARTSGRRAC